MRLPDRAGCEWNGYTTWVAGYGGWVRWCSGGWYTITTRVITLPEYICRRPEWRAQVHARGSPEYRVQGILGSVAGAPIRLHEVL